MTEKAEPQRQERSSWTTRLWRAGGILQDSTSERLVDSGLHQGPFGLGGDSPERCAQKTLCRNDLDLSPLRFCFELSERPCRLYHIPESYGGPLL